MQILGGGFQHIVGATLVTMLSNNKLYISWILQQKKHSVYVL